MYIYINLKYLRQSYGLNKKQFADKIGTNVSNVSRWENSKNGITLDTAIQISNKLNIPLADLVGKDLSVKENVELDNSHKLDYIVMEKTKTLTEEDKEKLISVIDTIFDKDSKK